MGHHPLVEDPSFDRRSNSFHACIEDQSNASASRGVLKRSATADLLIGNGKKNSTIKARATVTPTKPADEDRMISVMTSALASMTDHRTNSFEHAHLSQKLSGMRINLSDMKSERREWIMRFGHENRDQLLDIKIHSLESEIQMMEIQLDLIFSKTTKILKEVADLTYGIVGPDGTDDGSAKVGRTPPPLPEDVYVSAGGGNVGDDLVSNCLTAPSEIESVGRNLGDSNETDFTEESVDLLGKSAI